MLNSDVFVENATAEKSNEEFEKMVQKREVSVNEVYVCAGGL